MNPHAPDSLINAAYADLARPVEPLEEPVGAVRRLMRRRSRRRRLVGAALVTSVVAVVAFATVQGVSDPTPRASGNAGGNAGGAVAPQSGALPNGATQSCAVGYDRKTLEARTWAADATVARIGRGSVTVTVDLNVTTWYRGGSGDTLRVRLPSPRSETEDAPPAYGPGTRLLLSGARTGGELLPWACGFTRYYDARTAAVWAQVFAR